jgi:hypothetical protein
LPCADADGAADGVDGSKPRVPGSGTMAGLRRCSSKGWA